MDDSNHHKPFPYVSLAGAVVFTLSMIVLTLFEMTHTSDPHLAADRARVVTVMVCVLLASLSSIVSISTALCPLILGQDRRPLMWVVPLLLGWLLFLQWFEWRSLVTRVQSQSRGIPLHVQQLKAERQTYFMYNRPVS